MDHANTDSGPIHRIAVIADPHFHDTGWQPEGSGISHAYRSYKDSAGSTRVFNESAPAFRTALDRAVAEGAKLVIIPGDLTDDGQAHNIASAVALLRDYSDRHGIRFFATPGNHDFYAISGRPQVKQFVADNGLRIMLDSKNLAGMATIGTETGLRMMPDLGYTPHPDDLHWETPYGVDPDYVARSPKTYSPDGSVFCNMIDASYLVEPVAGVWLLSIDANICVPRNDATDFDDPTQFHDPNNAGWPSVFKFRPQLLHWMRDVARRATQQKKQLIAFSHYPTLDPLAGTSTKERALLGLTSLSQRDPGLEVASIFATTGVRLHLSGHLHVNDISRYGDEEQGFFNIAMPSTVGYAPAIKLLDLDNQHVRIQTILLDQVPEFDVAFEAYHREAIAAGEQPQTAVTASDYGIFIDRHLCDLIASRYLPQEWPDEMRNFVASATFADLERLIWPDQDISTPVELPLIALCEDWYRLRKAADLALNYIPAERIALYWHWFSKLPATSGIALNCVTLRSQFQDLLIILEHYLNRLPTLDITLDLQSLQVAAVRVEPSAAKQFEVVD